jgi:uncharacterized phage protein gp47/JayE
VTDPDTGFVRDTFAEIVARVRGDFDARGLTHSRIGRSLLYPFPFVIAGVSLVLQGKIGWAVAQSFVDLADALNVRRWGRLLGVLPIDAEFAQGAWTFTGTPAAVVPIGTAFTLPTGEEYTTDVGAVIPGGGSIDIVSTASEAGEASNVSTGQTATITTPIAGVSSTVTAAADIENGADEESVEDQAVRIAERMAETPQGGAAADYVAWVRASQANVNNVGVLHPSDNLVNVYFTVDDGFGVASGVIPSASQVTEAQDYIDEVDSDGDAIRRPVTALATVIAPTATATAFTIALSNDTTANRTAVEDALDDLFERLQDPGNAYTITRSQYVSAAQNALLEDESLDITVPAGDVVVAAGDVGTVGAIAWV